MKGDANKLTTSEKRVEGVVYKVFLPSSLETSATNAKGVRCLSLRYPTTIPPLPLNLRLDSSLVGVYSTSTKALYLCMSARDDLGIEITTFLRETSLVTSYLIAVQSGLWLETCSVDIGDLPVFYPQTPFHTRQTHVKCTTYTMSRLCYSSNLPLAQTHTTGARGPDDPFAGQTLFL